VGCDLNKIKHKPTSTNVDVSILEEFSFVDRWKELLKAHGKVFTHAVSFEVIEHMAPEDGLNLLKGVRNLLIDDGVFFLSTPVYDGVHHAKNHIHEYTIEELTNLIKKAGFEVERRFGTFMNLRDIEKATKSKEEHARLGLPAGSLGAMYKAMSEYYDNEAVSCFFAPLFPDLARNNLWVLRKIVK
jgi:hypothetical protein